MTGTTLMSSQRVMQYWVLGAWGALFALAIWQPLRQGFSASQLLRALCFAIPLLLPLPGLLKARRRTHAWAALCVLPYFVVGITESVANAALRNWALLLLGCSLLWFFALLGFLRVTTNPETVQTHG